MFYGIIDTIGEGLTALLMKTDKQIKALVSMIDPEGAEDLNNKAAFGNFYNFRNLVRTLALFAGGVLAGKSSVGVVYLGLGLSAIIFALYTMFGFYEPKVIFWFIFKEKNLFFGLQRNCA